MESRKGKTQGNRGIRASVLRWASFQSADVKEPMKSRKNGSVKEREGKSYNGEPKERNLVHKWMKWGTKTNTSLLIAWKE